VNGLIKLRTTKSNVSVASARDSAAALWSETATPLGQLYIAANDRGLCAIKFGRLEPDSKSLVKSPIQRDRQNNLSNQVCSQLEEYFSGRRRIFELPLDLSPLTPFQRQVLAVTSRIPWGEVWSYQRVAREMGRAKSSRPVGQALGRNPIPIVIPCHRVIASDGGLGGYCGESGLDIKRWLLRLEGVQW
jgi:methylated-DNA-[protein]-cysteine S-methyltransferase